MDRIDPQRHQHSPAHTTPIPPAVTAAVTQYEAATLRYDELAAKPLPLTAADLEAFLNAQGAIAQAVVVLADHRRLDLTAPAETASRYRQAAAHCRRYAADADFDACADTQDEMAMCRCQLAAAGRLDLIGAGA
jgi:hypothetical protein